MSEKVEEVARALEPQDFPQEDDPEHCWCEECRKSLATRQEVALIRARTAIETMRIPTEAMIRAGDSEIPDNVGYTNDAKAVYRAMLNEALK